MEVSSVNCNNCGAPLEVGPGTNFVTCSHCGARLAVKRTATSSYTELMEHIDRKTDAISAQLAEIARQNELERIDREWDQERQGYLTKTKNGNQTEPNAAAGIVVAVVMGLFAVLWMGFTGTMGAPFFFPLFGFFFLGVAVFVGFASVTQAKKFTEAKARYEQRRRAALAGKPADPD